MFLTKRNKQTILQINMFDQIKIVLCFYLKTKFKKGERDIMTLKVINILFGISTVAVGGIILMGGETLLLYITYAGMTITYGLLHTSTGK